MRDGQRCYVKLMKIVLSLGPKWFYSATSFDWLWYGLLRIIYGDFLRHTLNPSEELL